MAQYSHCYISWSDPLFQNFIVSFVVLFFDSSGKNVCACVCQCVCFHVCEGGKGEVDMYHHSRSTLCMCSVVAGRHKVTCCPESAVSSVLKPRAPISVRDMQCFLPLVLPRTSNANDILV